MSTIQLSEIRNITGQIVIETGLHIGAAQEALEIGGLDNPILRDPATSEPYIPGSSLKGRMRSLAEWARGEVPPDGNVTAPIAGSDTAAVFGLPAKSEKQARSNGGDPAPYQRGPTRLVVRDARLANESREMFRKGRPITDVKQENSIDRLRAEAKPRPMERVLPGVRFDLNILYRIFDVDGDAGQRDRDLFNRIVLGALALVQADALGGNSSRGYGKIRFENLQVNDQPCTLPGPDQILAG